MTMEDAKSSEDATNKPEIDGDQTARRELVWDGITRSTEPTSESAQLRQQLADLAKSYQWRKVLDLLSENPQLINAMRPGGHSLYAPLHQSAHGGAAIEVVAELLRLGAFRTLKDAKGNRAVDIARSRSHAHLLSILEPVYERFVSATILSKIQRHFHKVIRSRANNLVREYRLRLPELEPILEFGQSTFWFAVPGMYGGFAYWLAEEGPNAKLISESWCRVLGGSGQRHEITERGSTLVEEGFV